MHKGIKYIPCKMTQPLELVFWKKIRDTGYLVSTKGEVKNAIRNRNMSFATKNGRNTVEIGYGTYRKTRKVDELVTESFIRQIAKNEIVVHLNGDLLDDELENLRLMKIESYLSFLHGASWKLIEDASIKGDYYISQYGKIWSRSTETFLSTRMHTDYPTVSIGYQSRQVHILVAKAFVENPNPDVYDIVNHIDEDVTNYLFSNLEWCTNQYNTIYSLKRSGRSIPRKNNKVEEEKGGVETRVKGYLVYKNGKVYSRKSNIYLLTAPNGSGYPRVEMNGKKYLVHLLVADAFLEHPPDDGNVYEIDHVDTDKTNNSVDNLEWVTRSEQMKRCVKAHSATYFKTRKPVIQLTLNDEIVEIFPGIKEASRKTNINSGSIVKACKGVRPSAGGYHWKYKLEISP